MINNKYKHCLSKIGQGGGVWDEFLFAIGSVWVQPYDVHVYTVSVQDMIAIEQKTYSVTNEFPGSPLIKTGEGGGGSEILPYASLLWKSLFVRSEWLNLLIVCHTALEKNLLADKFIPIALRIWHEMTQWWNGNVTECLV